MYLRFVNTSLFVFNFIFYNSKFVTGWKCAPSSWLSCARWSCYLQKIWDDCNPGFGHSLLMCVFKLLAKEETCPHWLHLWASLLCVCQLRNEPVANCGLKQPLFESLKPVSRLPHHMKWRCSTRNPHKNHPGFYKRVARQELDELLRVLKCLKLDQFSFWYIMWMTLTLRKWDWHWGRRH